MGDFIIQDSSIACNTLEINNVNFPTVYVDNTYLNLTSNDINFIHCKLIKSTGLITLIDL